MTILLNTNQIASRTKIALVQSGWHHDIVDEFRLSFITEFKQIDGRIVDTFSVPGAFEIPLYVKQLAESGEYAAVVAAGLVVDGGIYRHEFVASAVIDGLMRVQLDTGMPVFSGVLTPHDFMSEGRADFFREHFIVKGVEAAKACAQTLNAYKQAKAA
ncbi:MAG: 6,7-dimethyl-8-ribityllumazine synthase [Pseudomonadales bacterium]|nr:6,7-dimethyl-8-ribityllumazine synthase [Pseudomonadales bacterium]